MKKLLGKLKNKAGIVSLVVLLCTGCSFGLAGCGMLFTELGSSESKEEGTGSNLWDLFSGAGADGETEDDEAFLEKADNLRTLIDLYYLEDTEESDLYEGMYHGM